MVNESAPSRPGVLVTGAARGIGAAVVTRALAAGHPVIAVDRDAEALQALVAALPSSAVVHTVTADVSQADQVRAAVALGEQQPFGIGVLVNNAGVAFAGGIEEHGDQDWDRLLAVNLSSAFYFVRAALPALRRARGTIVNVSSMTGIVGQPRGAGYSASKGGLIAMTRALALELGPEGIRVNCVCPAGVDTPLMQSWAAQQPDPRAVLEGQARMHVLGRMATPQEIAETIWFLASDAGSFMTGAILEVDGGATLGYRRV